MQNNLVQLAINNMTKIQPTMEFYVNHQQFQGLNIAFIFQNSFIPRDDVCSIKLIISMSK